MLAMFGTALIFICIRADHIQRLIFCQVAQAGMSPSERIIEWQPQNYAIKCNFGENINGFDKWKFDRLNDSP